MAQNTEVLLKVRHFNRTDCTALRAFLNRVSLENITRLYYNEDDLEAMGCTSSQALRAYLEAMRDELIVRVTDDNPALAHSLQHARENFIWSKLAISYLVQAAEKTSVPRPPDPVSMWFRPTLASRLKEEDVRTLEQLTRYISCRGHRWYLPFPGLGAGRAEAIERWLAKDPLLAPKFDDDPESLSGGLVLVVPDRTRLVPLDRMSVPDAIAGAYGANRYNGLCLIRARTDIEAIRAYLMRYFEREKTLSAYTKEIERFYLWLIAERRKPLSECLYEECIAYMQFLADIPEHWQGKRAARGSPAWRPFAPGGLSPKSRAYAILVLRMFFAWLVGVRYLGADPWLTVPKFNLVQDEQTILVDKALASDLWLKLAGPGGLLDRYCAMNPAELRAIFKTRGWLATHDLGAYFRTVRAALLLMGATGLRIEEAASVLRNDISPAPDSPGYFDLYVTGKRLKRRLTVISPQVMEGLRAHWHDRQLPHLLERPLVDKVYVLAPLLNGSTRYTTRGLRSLIDQTLQRIATDTNNDLDESQRALLRAASPHAFRHTFGRWSVEHDMPLDVLQSLLGHASIQTTTIYVQAEKRRKRAEAIRAGLPQA